MSILSIYTDLWFKSSYSPHHYVYCFSDRQTIHQTSHSSTVTVPEYKDTSLMLHTVEVIPLLQACSTSVSYRLRFPKIGKQLRSTPSSKGGTLYTQTATDIYLSYPVFLRSLKAKLTNRLPTISNPTVPSPLCNLVSELVMGAPQPCSRS